MKIFWLYVSGFLILLSMIACKPGSTSAPVSPQEAFPPVTTKAEPAQGDTWSNEWDKTIIAARKESRLAISSTAGDSYRGLIPIFKEKFGIDVEIVMGKGAEVSQKLISEQRAGLYLVDVYVGGASTPVAELKPAGAFVPMKPYLILPEVLNEKNWLDNQLPWVDKEQIILVSAAYPNLTLGINRDLVKPGELKSYNDLLQPKWKGKVVLNDPTLAGVGGKWAVVVGTTLMNWDYLRKISKQEPVIITDQRIQVDWLAKGKYPIIMVPKPEIFKTYQEAGAPIDGLNLSEGTWLATGSSAFAMVKKAPHPNASKLFINWILSKEGQTFHSTALGIQSARLDVPADFLDTLSVRQPGTKYFNASTEEFLLSEPEHRKTVIEIFKSIGR